MTSARLVLPPDRRIMRYNGRRSYCLLLALRHVTSFMPRCTSGQSAIQLSRGWGLAEGGGGTVEVCTKIHSTCFFCFFYHHQLRRSCCHRYAPALSRDRASVLRMGWIGMESRSMSLFALFCFGTSSLSSSLPSLRKSSPKISGKFIIQLSLLP